MKTHIASLALLFFWHSAVAAAGAESKGAAVTAPGSAAAAAPSRSNEKCRLEEDGASPTWQAIGRQYSKLARAMQRKDLDALFALYAPSFEVRLPKEELATSTTGPVWNREQSLATQRARLAAVKESRLVSNTITRLLDCGDRATATVLQQWYGTQMVGNVLRNIETAVVQDEEWVKTADGWNGAISAMFIPEPGWSTANVSTPPKATIPTLLLTSLTPKHLETAPDDQILGVRARRGVDRVPIV
jgi:ketosteroid isomerase-like protein